MANDPAATPVDPAKPDTSTEQDKQRWLEAFDDMDDPRYRDPF